MLGRFGQQTGALLEQIGTGCTDREIDDTPVVDVQGWVCVEQMTQIRILDSRRHFSRRAGGSSVKRSVPGASVSSGA